MSDPASANPGAKPPLISSDLLGNIPQLVYLLYLVGLAVHPAAIAGVVLAYLHRKDATELERSHFDFQISTFWRGVAMIVLGVICAFFLFGFLILLFWAVWTIVRCVKGLSKLGQGQAMKANIGWGFG